MSAEREVFKQIDQLYDLKTALEQHYRNTGTYLLRLAFKEFMDEHPEVVRLICKPGPNVRFRVDLKDMMTNQPLLGLTVEEIEIQTGNVQLAKCLQALEDRCDILPDIFREMGFQELRQHNKHEFV